MSDLGAPLYEALVHHTAKGRASFHTPGHKGRAGLLGGLHPLAHDLTELPDTASLFDGGDAAEQAEKLAADAFGAALTLFSAGGCTLCIQTMLLLGAGAGARVLFARNSHRSAVHTAALLGLEPVWAWPTDENGQITAHDIDAGLTADCTVRAVYITSPDYYGNLADIPAIAAICRRVGVPLLVDNAHGSHLGAFGLHPLVLGADMTADSAHKTLPVMTGGAMLHIGHANNASVSATSGAMLHIGRNDEVGTVEIDRQTAKAAMALFGSTSPAFPVLASLDLARDWWVRAGAEAYHQTAEAVEQLANEATRQGIGVGAGALRDPARLTLDTTTLGVDGTAAASWFREQGCEPEYADARFVVFIVTPFNTPEELRRLQDAIAGLSPALRRGRFLNRRARVATYEYSGVKPTAAMSPRAALLAPSETVDAADAAGRVCARSVCPCPPGIAAVVPGEVIDREITEKLSLCGFDRLVVVKTS